MSKRGPNSKSDDREAFMRQRGVEPPTDRATQYERILRDLIAEIKEEFIELPDGATESCVHPCVYRAEARLREVGGE